MLFIFTNDLNDVIESPLTKIADDTKLSGEVETREGRAVIWRELNGLGEQARKNNIKFHRDKSCTWDNIKRAVQAGTCVGGEQPCWKGPGGPGGQDAEHETAAWCCSNEGRSDPGLHLQGH